MQGDNFEIFAVLFALHARTCFATTKKEKKMKTQSSSADRI